jgi:hypothetical protein
MNLRRAIQIVRRAAKSDIDSDVIADAIGLAGNYFLRETKLAKADFVVDVDVGTTEFYISDHPNFRPEQIIIVETVNYQSIDVRDYRELARMHAGNPAPSVETGRIRAIAFRTPASGIMYPHADASNDSFRITHYQPFTDIEGHDDNVQLNIPDQYAYEVMWYGASAVAEHRVPDAMFQTNAWAMFREFTRKVKEESVMAGPRQPSTTDPNVIDFRVKEGGSQWL